MKMQYVRIEENTQARVKVVMEELIDEARGIIYSNEGMEIEKDECNRLIRDAFEAIIKVVNDYKLTASAVSVWNKDTVNPGNIDVKFMDALWDFRTDAYFIIKRKTRKDQLLNRIHRLVDEVYVLMAIADRTAELEEERQAKETQTQETETQEEETMTYEIVTINGFGETVRVMSAPLFTTKEAAENYIEEHKYNYGADLWSVRAQQEEKTETSTEETEAPDTTVSEPQTQEEYVQPAWKRILAEIDKRREAEKVCVDIS